MLPVFTLIAVLAVQLLAVSAAYGLRSREEALRQKLPYLVSLAVGVLLATALLHLLPESVDALGNGRGVWLATGGTLFALFAAERLFGALTVEDVDNIEPKAGAADSHAHGPACAHTPGHRRTLRPINLLLASSLHSFVDGAAIATAFLVNPRLGLLTAVAVALHEVPHRLGDVAVLLHLGLAPARAVRFAAIVGVPALVGASAVLALGAGGTGVFRWLLPISAGSFLYIAGVNLLPELQTELPARTVWMQLLCLGVGVGVVLLATGMQAG